MSEPIEDCPNCGAKMKKYWHVLTPGLVHGLVKFRAAVVSKNRNRIHLLEDMEGDLKLTPHEWNNWTKLRFHALVAKVRIDGEPDRGYWLLTARGASFLKGEIQIPSKVLTFRNKVIDHGGEYVTVSDVIKEVPYFETIDDIQFEVATTEDGQGKLF